MTAPGPILAPPVIPGIRPPPDWMQRNYKWFVPLVVLVLFLGMCAVMAGSLVLIVKITKSSDVYRMTLARVESSPPVITTLGTPLKDGFFVNGNIHETYQDGQSSGTADLQFSISGPQGKGRVHVDATKVSGQWQFDDLYVKLKNNGKRIDVLATDSMNSTNEPSAQTSR